VVLWNFVFWLIDAKKKKKKRCKRLLLFYVNNNYRISSCLQ